MTTKRMPALGARAIVQADREQDGAMAAMQVLVGKDGLVPPM